MGVNRVGFGITDDEVVREASKQEIIRRYFKTGCEYKKGYVDKETFQRAKLIMEELDLKESDRKVVTAAREHLDKQKQACEKNELLSSVAMELSNEMIFTGKKSNVLDASSAVLINALKAIAGINDNIHLISPTIIEDITKLKKNTLQSKNLGLDCEEMLIALTISATTNPMAQAALDQLPMLKGAQLHSTTILGKGDEQTLRKLGVDVTSDPVFPTENLYYNE
ncbi:MAG: DUF1846 family protein, partial [Cetobacterium sp.]